MLLLCPVLLGTMLHLQPILLGTAFQSCWCLRFLGTRDEQKTEMNNLICRFKLFFFFLLILLLLTHYGLTSLSFISLQ